MDSTNLNLNLNFDPPDNTDEITRKGEFQGDMIGSESKMAVKKNEEIALVEELNRVRSENTKLTEMLFFLCDKYSSSKGHFMDLFSSSSEEEDLFSKTKKRKAEGEINLEGAIGIGINGDNENRSCSDHDGGGGGCCWKRPREIIKTSNVSKVHVKIDPSDTTLVVKDGYQWRKYGQKVTRDNPSPRAYYKCSFAPNCPVKKKVQRSVEDPSLLEAMYEGEHNHIHPNCQAVEVGFNQGLIPGSISSPFFTVSSSPSPNLISDSIRPTGSILGENAKKPSPVMDMPAFQQLLVEKMANSLSGNPSFTTALAAAISTRILDHDMTESWENTT